MANYVPSDLAIGQANLTSAFQRGEMRYRDPVIWKSLLANQPLSTPDYEALRTREDRSFEINFFNRTKRALSSGRSHAPTGTKSDTTVITPSFATKSDTFYTSIKQADRNVRTLQEMFNHEVQNSVLNFVDELEDLSANFLFNSRSGVNGVSVRGSFNATNDVYEITESTDGNESIHITKMVMDILKYKGLGLDIYCDSIMFTKFDYLRAQGGANSINTEYQFTSGNLTFYHSPDMDAEVLALGGGAYVKGFWLAAPKGMTVALDWIPQQNRKGIQNIANRTYGTIINPIDNLPYALFKYNQGADETANNGYTQDITETCELSLDVSFEDAPLTNAGETVIQAFALV
jgi:hypothetical protein